MSPPIQTPPVNAARARLHGLDTLRSIAILLVFMYHYMCFVSHAPTFGWASSAGWVGVDLFFVLSGYLIGNQLFAGATSGRTLSLKAFYARRLLRTLPNYYLILALYFLFPAVMGGSAPPALWKFMTFTQNYELTPGTAFSHAWSLCIEEQFYLVLPAAVLLAARFGKSIRLAWVLLGALMVGGVVLRTVLWLKYGREADGAIAGYYPHVYYSSFCRGDEFLPGIAVALLKNYHPRQWEWLMRHGQKIFASGLMATAIMACLIIKCYYIDDVGYGYFMSGFGYSLIAVCFALLVLAALSPATLLHRVRVPGAASLALWSYAIYLSHKPLATIIAKPLAAYGVAPGSVAAVLVISVASLLLGWLIYTIVERPFLFVRDRYFPSNFLHHVRLSTVERLPSRHEA